MDGQLLQYESDMFPLNPEQKCSYDSTDATKTRSFETLGVKSRKDLLRACGERV